MQSHIIAALVVLSSLTGCQTVDLVTKSITGLIDDITGSEPDETVAHDPAPPTPPTIAAAPPAPPPTAISTPPPPMATALTTGAVSATAVLDGDTIELSGKRVRLHGIDAPELAQTCREGTTTTPCGEIARNALIGLAAGATVQCERRVVDRYGRDVSVCRAGGFDLSAALVRTGMAVAYRKYSGDYVAQENEARTLQRGMWRGSFDMPWDWRARNRQ